jgi:MYXO-CTERM domain-containing protein
MRKDVRQTNLFATRPASFENRGTSARRTLLLAFLLACSQTSCVLVGGYSSEGGWYIWPGSLLITAAALALFFLLGRRRRR